MAGRRDAIVSAVVTFVVFSFAMAALGARMQMRTGSALGMREKEGTALWGARLSQSGLSVAGPGVVNQATETEGTRIDVSITMDYRRRGMTWLTSYVAAFNADYTVTYRGHAKVQANLTFPLPGQPGGKTQAAGGFISDIQVLVDGKRAANAVYSRNEVKWTEAFDPNQTKSIRVGYKARGMSQYIYQLPHDTKIKSLEAGLKVEGAKDIDFPTTCMSPTERSELADGWQLAWKAKDVITGLDIGVILPDRESPSQQLTALTMWGPLLLALYLLAILGAMSLAALTPRPIQMLLASAAFSIFYPLISYIAHYMPIRPALAISLGVVLALTVNYFRMAANLRFALAYPSLAVLGLLGFASVAILLPEYTGLLLTLGAVVALGVIMQMTARARGALAERPGTGAGGTAPKEE